MPYGFRVLVDRPSAFFPNTEFDDGRSINNSHSIHTSHLGGADLNLEGPLNVWQQ